MLIFTKRIGGGGGGGGLASGSSSFSYLFVEMFE